MRFQIFFLFLLLTLCTAVLPAPKAEAADVTAVVTRMDTIIKQMEALKAEFAALASSIGSTPSGAVLGVQATPVFTLSLEQGETNDDIKKIQKLLATDREIYPYGVASGFFGPKTEEGIKNFQTRFNLDPVGVVGPATKALLELFLNAYPDGNYPADVLLKKPQVQGASVSTYVPPAPVVSNTSSNISKITAKYDGDEARVKISYNDDTSNSFLISGDTKIEVVDGVATKLGKTRAQILALIEFTSSNDDDDEDEDEDEDDDFDIDVEIDDDEVTITFTFDDDDYEVEVDSTDEDDVLDEVADELNEDLEDIDDDLIDAIEDALEEALDDEDDEDGDGDEIESITAKIENGEAQIEVEYGNGDDEEFTVEEDKESAIIEEVADELNIDEDEVEDLIEFKYEDIEEINVEIRPGNTAVVYVEFEDGTTKRIIVDSEDEDEIIEELAEILDEDENDIEDWINFD